MKIYLNFIPQNTTLKGVKNIGLYDSHGNKLKTIPLGNLAPKSTGNILYTFGALSDVHLPVDTGPDDFVRALNYLNSEEKVDFICISGDMGSSGTDAEWASYKNYVDTYSPNTPVYISAGNHDAGQSARKSYDYPIPYTGNPLYYSFTQGDDVFIIFGISLWGDPPFTNESLQWLYETLEANRNKRCFVFEHFMRYNGCGNANGTYYADNLNNTNGKVFLSLMEHYKNVLWFHGHSHTKFNVQEVMPSPIANYDRMFGCHSIHVPGLCYPRDKDMKSFYAESEGYVVDVYKNGIHLRGRDFVAEKFLPIASYWIDTTLTEIAEKSYVDSRGVIDTSESSKPSDDEITLPEGATYTLNARESYTSKSTSSENGMLLCKIPCEPNTDYTLLINNKVPLNTPSKGSKYSTIFGYNENKTNAYILTGNVTIREITSEYITYANEKATATITFTTTEDTHFIMLSLVVSDTGAITEDDLAGIVLTLEKTSVEEPPVDTDIIVIDNSKIVLDGRYSQSSGEIVETGGVLGININVKPNTTYKLKYTGSITDITAGYDRLYLLNAKGTISTVNGNTSIHDMTQGTVYNSDNTGVEVTFTTYADTTNIWFNILFKEAGQYIKSVDQIANVVCTIQEID